MTTIERRVLIPLSEKLWLRDYAVEHDTTMDDLVGTMVHDYNKGELVPGKRERPDESSLLVEVEEIDWLTAVGNAADDDTSMKLVVRAGIARLRGQ